jgi:hypothetical protein
MQAQIPPALLKETRRRDARCRDTRLAVEARRLGIARRRFPSVLNRSRRDFDRSGEITCVDG